MIDLENRYIFLTGGITHKKAQRLNRDLHRMMHTGTGEILIFLDSDGGVIEAGFAMYESVRKCSNEVEIVGRGRVFSAAAMVFQAADVRTLDKHVMFMIHDGTTGGLDGPVTTLDSRLVRSRFCDDRYYEILAERSGLSDRKVRKLCRKESYLTSDEALELGFCDQVE